MGFLPQSGIPTFFREGRIRSRLIGKEDDSSPVIREEEECLSEESKLLFLQKYKSFPGCNGGADDSTPYRPSPRKAIGRYLQSIDSKGL